MRIIVLIVLSFSIVLTQDIMEFIDESFDPLELNEPELEWPMMIQPDAVEETDNDTIKEVPDSTVLGYRIQVLSTQEDEEAEQLKDKLFNDFNGEVYVTFDPPNYKVRIGNFSTRSEAEKVQKRVVKMGYRTAWIIRTRVIYKQRVW